MFVRPSKIFVWGAWIWDGGTKEEIRISKEALFKGVSTRFGLRIVDSSVENAHFIRYGEQKIAQGRTHYLTKESPYVSTQQSGQDTLDTKMI
jgi:hypothetical protein